MYNTLIAIDCFIDIQTQPTSSKKLLSLKTDTMEISICSKNDFAKLTHSKNSYHKTLTGNVLSAKSGIEIQYL